MGLVISHPHITKDNNTHTGIHHHCLVQPEFFLLSCHSLSQNENSFKEPCMPHLRDAKHFEVSTLNTL